MKTPKTLAAEIVLDRIRVIYEAGNISELAEINKFSLAAVRQKIAAIHNQIAKEHKLKERLDEV